MSFSVRPEATFRIPTAPVRRASSPRRLAIAVAVLFGLTSVFAYASPSPTFGWDAESFSANSEADLLRLTNRSRANAGRSALRVDSTLTDVARWRSKDMIQRDYFSHTIPGYGKVWDKLGAIGYCYHVAGENIGWNNYPDDIATAAVHAAFMDSDGHRENIMGKDWDRIGIGAYKGADGRKMWTVLFADKCGSSATPKPTAKPKPKPTAKSTPKPAARSTPRPTPRKTPTPEKTDATPKPTPKAAETPAPLSTATLDESDLIPVDEIDGFGSQPPDAVSADPIPPSQDPGGDTAGDGVVMRVVDGGGTNGLFQSIVGGVAGLFLGG